MKQNCTMAYEELHPDLVPFIEWAAESADWATLHHPSVIYMHYEPELNGIINAQYQQRREDLSAARAMRKWSHFVSLHERPYRLDALSEVLELGLHGAAYWRLLAEVWADSENIHQNLDAWQDLWEAEEPRKHLAMNGQERDALRALPDLVPVWRGANCREGVEGMSWTTDHGRALWFARRFAMLADGAPHVFSGHVRRADIHAYFLGRGESEVVVPFERVNDVRELDTGGAASET